jgi:pimeloyl-ACP methyl ester carboxylesterase
MTRARVARAVAIVGGCLLSFGAAEASAAILEPCKRAATGRTCATLTVPLDRTGAVPGTVKLRIERQQAKRAARPPLFLIAGGPGQSATGAFDAESVSEIAGTEARSRDIVVMDLRGTGRSGALECPALQRGSTRAVDVAACAVELGPRRDHYSSVDIADDIDAVRAALGDERIAIYGVSYGTYVAQVYARRYPARIDRLVLDSVVGPAGVDAFERPSMAAVPRVLERRCGKRRCRAFMRNPGGDVARLATRLDLQPMTGHVVDRNGRRHRRTIDGRGLLDAVVAGDIGTFGIFDQLPGAIRSALRGDAAPLLRARAGAVRGGAPPRSARSLSAAAYVATLCTDTLLPWGSAVPVADRQAAAEAMVASLTAGAFSPFGARTALASDVLEACRAWPSRPASAGVPMLGPLPGVPVLLLAGGSDVRTPIESARAVAAQFPRASVISVANSKHGVLSWDMTGCPSRAVRRFLAGGAPGRCGPGARFDSILPPLPTTLADIPGGEGPRGRVRRTAKAAVFTMLDGAFAVMAEMFTRMASAEDPFAAMGDGLRVGALRGGTYALSFERPEITFRRAEVVRGVRVSGRLLMRRAITGRLRISGPAAARGVVAIRRGGLVGRLAGRRVGIRGTDDLSGLGDVRSSSVALARYAAQLTRTGPRVSWRR